MSLHPIPLPAFQDNYIWCLEHNGQALVVDPGDPEVVSAWLTKRRLQLATILVTHHHPDHTAGLPALRQQYQPQIHGPDENIQGVQHLLFGGEALNLGAFGQAHVMAIPGHTRAHIAYYLPEAALLFCGDTLFSAGCGRLFEGTPTQMYQSLKSIAALPDRTQVCCTHEYTEANLRFALAAEPGNAAITERSIEVAALRAQQRPSLPVMLARERTYNPFLRCDSPALIARLERETGVRTAPGLPTFTALRAWKDRF